MPEDAIIIGGGIVGMATGLALAARGCAPVVLEAEDRLAAHQTGHNSGVIHSGLYYRPGSLKATMCRDGYRAMYEFCREHGIAHRRTGKLVVAASAEELPRLQTLADRGRANGLTVHQLTDTDIRKHEPEARGVGGLWIEETGVVDYSAVTAAMASRLAAMGGRIEVGTRVTAIHRFGGLFAVETSEGNLTTHRLANCAGLQADRIARMAGLEPRLQIVAFRGEYYTLRADRAHLVRGLIYPVPDPELPFLGVHLTRGVDNVVEAGPNAVLAFSRAGYRWGDVSLGDLAEWAAFPGFWRMAKAQWRNGLVEARRSLSRDRFVASLQRLVPAITSDDVVRRESGVRAQAVDRSGRLLDDFVLEELPGAVHVLNAPSPAATASLAIGGVIAARLLANAPR